MTSAQRRLDAAHYLRRRQLKQQATTDKYGRQTLPAVHRKEKGMRLEETRMRPLQSVNNPRAYCLLCLLTLPRVGLKCNFTSLRLQPEWIDALHSPGDHSIAPNLTTYVRDNFEHTVRPYLESFNKWIPVIDGASLRARSQDTESLQDEALSVLLLSCMLLSRVSRPNLTEMDLQGNRELYLTLIASHTTLLTRDVKSLDILQSKVLLALYEHLQSNHMAAVSTIGSAAAIAKVMGLFRWHCQAGPEAITIWNDEQRVVCCLFILERLIHTVYHDAEQGPTLLSCPKPCPRRMMCDGQGVMTILPSSHCRQCEGNQMSITASSPNAPYPSLLSRLFQAAVLVELAMDNSAASSSTSTAREQLEKDISKLASAIHEDRCQGAEVNCSVLGLCVSCILILHSRSESSNRLPNITMALRMVFDRLTIVPALQYKFSKIISLWELHCFYLAAIMHNRLDPQPALPTFTDADHAYAATVNILQDYSTGWKIAGELLSKIDSSTEVKPHGNTRRPSSRGDERFDGTAIL